MKRIDTIGMRIVAVAPGITRTPMYVEDAEKIIMIDDERDVWIEPEEMAAVMLALVEKDEINSRFGGTNDGETVPIENGTILEVSKGHVRSVQAFHDPGPTAPGTIASNHDACDEASMALLKEGWGAN
jgi:3-hydroxybutyrate dehydrogenase